jgi:hypothetical protein
MPFGLTPKAKASARCEAKKKPMKPDAPCTHALLTGQHRTCRRGISSKGIYYAAAPVEAKITRTGARPLPTRHEVRCTSPSRRAAISLRNVGYMQVSKPSSTSAPKLQPERANFEHIESTGRVLREGIPASRRAALAYVFSDICGCPPPEEWYGQRGTFSLSRHFASDCKSQ